jgi:hypothetical protein
MKGRISYLLLLAVITVAFLVAASPPPDREVTQALKDQNEQLKRIATSLEIIAGQRGSWKIPRN